MNSLFVSLLFLIGISFCEPLRNGMVRVPAEYPTIQAGIDAAQDGDTVLVGDGVYTGAGNRGISLLGKAISVKSEFGRANCVIDCEDMDRAFLLDEEEGDRSIIEGFTIQNGAAPDRISGFPDWYAKKGGAILCAGSSPQILACQFRSNKTQCGAGTSCPPLGGAIYLQASSSRIQDCVFIANYAQNFDYTGPAAGGAIFASSANPQIINCTFMGNWSYHGSSFAGLAVYMSSGMAFLEGCVFQENGYHAEGSCLEFDQGIIVNCEFLANNGSLAANDFSAWNCLFTQNVEEIFCRRGIAVNFTAAGNSGYSSGGVYAWSDKPSFTLIDSILWNNEAPQIAASDEAAISVRHCDVQGGWPGESNLDADPLFASGPPGGYCLSQIAAGQAQDSPCLDAGHRASAAISLPLAEGFASLAAFSTRGDGAPDSGQADLGYHYPAADYATPTPFPEPAEPLALRLEMPVTFLTPGASCWLRAYLSNRIGAARDVPFVTALEAAGQYWFWDGETGWGPEFDYALVPAPLGRSQLWLIPPLLWPDLGAEAAQGLAFWAALVNPADGAPLTNLAHLEFGYGPGAGGG